MMERSHSCACHTLLTLAMGAFAVAGMVAVVCAVKQQMPRWKKQMQSVGEDCRDCCEDIGRSVRDEVRDCAEKIKCDLEDPPCPSDACPDCE